MNLRYEFYGNGMWLLREVSGWLRWLRQGSFIDSPLKLANLCRKCSNKAKNKWLNGCCQKRSKKKNTIRPKVESIRKCSYSWQWIVFYFFHALNMQSFPRDYNKVRNSSHTHALTTTTTPAIWERDRELYSWHKKEAKLISMKFILSSSCLMAVEQC